MPKKKIRPVEASVENSELIWRMEGFSSRFNVDIEKKDKAIFKNRCISAIAEYIGNNRERIDTVTTKVFHLLGRIYAGDSTFNFDNSHLYRVLSDAKYTLNTDEQIYEWLLIIECILGTEFQNNYGLFSFSRKIAEILKLSGINAVLCDTADGYLFYPANAEFLDQKIIIDVLNWLNDYPKAKEQYSVGLRLFLRGDRTRNLQDSFRLSFELFLKQYFNNNYSIENQLKIVGEFLKERNVSTEMRNMYSRLTDYYAKYNNQHIKHNDDTETIAESEMEFSIYLTGCFIRFLIQVKKEEIQEKGKVK